MKKFYLEGYGCSLNIGETEQISGFLKKNKFIITKKVSMADFIIINTCSVKMVTEQRMISRIQKFLSEKKDNAKIIVTGCLAKTNKTQLEKLGKNIIVLDTKLESLAKILGLKKEKFSPKIIEEKSKKYISIIPISVGCIGNCTYCATKLARGNLVSYSIKDINNSFKRALKSGSKEIWITSQDNGCYGFDNQKTLPDLIKVLLKNKGDYRIRIGMMNPRHFKKIKKELMPLFKDERLYKFLHLPLQSGSNKVLNEMNRMTTVEEFLDVVNSIRKEIPTMRISTDIIVGFPKETELEFKKSIKAIKDAKINVLNTSKFGKRKGTIAATMSGQWTESEKKARSTELVIESKNLFAKENKKLIGTKHIAFVSEKAMVDGFVARNGDYAPVIVDSGFGKFIELEITSSFPYFFKGKVLRIIN
jgi:threonylcarbamoyladenosine tRNA methylthiotransferase CDKAL1